MRLPVGAHGRGATLNPDDTHEDTKSGGGDGDALSGDGALEVIPIRTHISLSVPG